MRFFFFAVCFCFGFFLISAGFVLADTQGQNGSFFVDPGYDSALREKVPGFLEVVSANGYFYLEEGWLASLSKEQQKQATSALADLALEFEQKIYPRLTAVFGQEWKPGIDNDNKVTVFFHKTKSGVAGYFRSEDGYPIQQAQKSNEREMVYLNIEYLNSQLVKSFLAHELTHLISFNQKERLKSTGEDIWLNEARADFAPTLLDYDLDFQNSNLKQRVRDFLDSPSDSLTDWQNQRADYGVLDIFMQYLANQYGYKIIASTLESFQPGLESLKEALRKWNIKESFSQIFTDWTIAVFLNNCQVNARYCLKSEALSNLKITPSLIFLPLSQTDIVLNYYIKPWSGQWYRVIAGGEGDLRIIFQAQNKASFRLSYVLCQKDNTCSVSFLTAADNAKTELFLPNFSQSYNTLTFIPSLQPESRTLDENNQEPVSTFSLSVALENTAQEKALIAGLLQQIEVLKAQISQAQARLNAAVQKSSCSAFAFDLYLGQKNNSVECLQMFLKNQGKDIYPEGIISGFFGALTQKAVTRFQEKYKNEILSPAGLSAGNGYVGRFTRTKINALLTQ